MTEKAVLNIYPVPDRRQYSGYLEMSKRQFPGDPVVRTRHFHCWRPENHTLRSACQGVGVKETFVGWVSGGSRRRPWVGKAELGCPAYQASLSLTNSWSLLKLIPIESMMPPTVSFPITPFFSRPQSFPASGCFPVSGLLASGGQSIGALASVLSTNSQGWFP